VWVTLRSSLWLDYMASGNGVTDELQRTGKNAVVAYPRYHHGICLGVLRNITKILSRQPVPTPRFELSKHSYANPFGPRRISFVLWGFCKYFLVSMCINQKVAGSIPDEVTGFFNWRNPSSRTLALGSTQPLTEMSIRHLPVCKGRPAGA
jgi:hypothetical protein